MNKIIQGLHHFRLRDYAVYEITVFVAGLLCAKLFPVLLTGPLRVYILLAVAGTVYIFYRIGHQADTPAR